MRPPTHYFPLGIAKGDAFCNRVIERKKLIGNIERNKHTLIISPRRYGKSSLVLYCLAEKNISSERVDLFVAINAKTIAEQLLKGTKKLISKITTAPEQAVVLVKNYIKNLKSKWVVGTDGINLELIPENYSDPASIIMESLQMLEDILKKKNRKAVFFIDEFQEIGKLAIDMGIEGAIRHVAQECENLCLIFSGSNRHILANMFDDRSRPLYMLCDRIKLERISEQDYYDYLNKVAHKTWKKKLDEKTLSEIFKATEYHPYYVNALCDMLWTFCEKTPPKNKDVQKIWRNYVLQEESKVAKEIITLNTSQKKILIAISQNISHELSSKENLYKLNLSSGAVAKSLKQLEELDFINKNTNNEYFIVDPLIKSALLFFYPPII